MMMTTMTMEQTNAYLLKNENVSDGATNRRRKVKHLPGHDKVVPEFLKPSELSPIGVCQLTILYIDIVLISTLRTHARPLQLWIGQLFNLFLNKKYDEKKNVIYFIYLGVKPCIYDSPIGLVRYCAELCTRGAATIWTRFKFFYFKRCRVYKRQSWRLFL